MKTPKAVIVILCAILATNIAGVALHTMEMKKQTDIALKTAELEAIEAHLVAYEMQMNYASQPQNSNGHLIGEEASFRDNNILNIRWSLRLPNWYQKVSGATYENGIATGYGEDGTDRPDFLK